MFVVKLMAILGCCLFVMIVHFINVVCLRRLSCRERVPSLLGTVGSIFLVLFVATTCTILSPFQCVGHPNGKTTLRNYPSVVCWESAAHSTMTIWGLAGLALPLIFLTTCVTAIYKLPTKARQGDTTFLHLWSFLVANYRSEASWFSLVTLVRNLLLSLVRTINRVCLPECFATVRRRLRRNKFDEERASVTPHCRSYPTCLTAMGT